jgi:hypothetical protein
LRFLLSIYPCCTLPSWLRLRRLKIFSKPLLQNITVLGVCQASESEGGGLCKKRSCCHIRAGT